MMVCETFTSRERDRNRAISEPSLSIPKSRWWYDANYRMIHSLLSDAAVAAAHVLAGGIGAQVAA
jgi:hypothetical protein